MRQLASEKVEGHRDCQCYAECLYESHLGEPLGIGNVISTNLVADEDTRGLLNTQAYCVAQGCNLHRNHHVGLSFGAQSTRHYGKKLPGPVLRAEHDRCGHTEAEVLLPSDPDGRVRPKICFSDLLDEMRVYL